MLKSLINDQIYVINKETGQRRMNIASSILTIQICKHWIAISNVNSKSDQGFFTSVAQLCSVLKILEYSVIFTKPKSLELFLLNLI